MTDHPNYRDLNPPPTPEEARRSDDLDPEDDDVKPRDDWTYSERRAELYDMIERAGDWRNLSTSLRELGDRYGVSHTTIRNDIDAVLEWEAANLSTDVDVELSMLQRSAVQDYLRAARQERAAENYEAAAELKKEAHELVSDHLEELMETGEVERAAERLEAEVDAEVESSTEHTIEDETRELALEVIRARQAADAGDDVVDEGGDAE